MSKACINIEDAVVTNIHEFKSKKGYGVDFYVTASTNSGIIYFQVVTYDEFARKCKKQINLGDHVDISGNLKVKVYNKKNDIECVSLYIENPLFFAAITNKYRVVLTGEC